MKVYPPPVTYKLSFAVLYVPVNAIGDPPMFNVPVTVIMVSSLSDLENDDDDGTVRESVPLSVPPAIMPTYVPDACAVVFDVTGLSVFLQLLTSSAPNNASANILINDFIKNSSANNCDWL